MPTHSVTAKIDAFSTYMANTYGFDRSSVRELLVSTEPDRSIFKYFHPHHKRMTREDLDRLKRLAAQRITEGVKFYADNKVTLMRAQKEYGVPAEVIVALLGIETEYGHYVGGFKEYRVLITLAFYGHHRPEYFREELADFLVLARTYAWDIRSIPSSYAGAIGMPQFMPSNMNAYAVDFDNDSSVDLMDPSDAIGSVAKYLHDHGWQQGSPIATRTYKYFRGKTFVLRTLPAPRATRWYKDKNFYVLRAYNPLDSYAMSIFVLSVKIKDGVEHERDNIDPSQVEMPAITAIKPANIVMCSQGNLCTNLPGG